MRSISYIKLTVILLALICAGLFCFPTASYGEYTYYKPITEIDLGVKRLDLTVGETYVFPMTHKPEETPAEFITWLADDSILLVDPDHLSVTALASGSSRLYVESNAGFTWDFCDITVHGPESKDGDTKTSGALIVTISASDRKKIKAQTVQNYINFLEMNSFTSRKLDEVTKRLFNVTAIAEPGTVDFEASLAASLGMEKALPLPDLDAVSLRGTITQILAFAANNPNLIKIIEFAPMSIDDPVARPDAEGNAAKNLILGDHVETLTQVSAAHDAGFTGAGTVVVIIDTGLDKDHEQFQGRVINEACYAADGYENYHPVCTEGSSEPSLSQLKMVHNHGSHVAGIAVGKDGIAPDAGIISISISVEDCSGSNCVQTLYWSPYEVGQYLKNLQDSYRDNEEPLITVVNMSMGSGLYADTCDPEGGSFIDMFDLLTENGMIPVVSSGNGSSDTSISLPGCLSNVFTVGALTESSEPTIAEFSNHNDLVDILAPGTEINSSIYVYQNDSYIGDGVCEDGTGGSVNCYGISQGTSMAAPMVSGGFAIMKQAYPELSVDELESKMLSLSNNTADRKETGVEFDFSTPILNFSKMAEKPPFTCGVNVHYEINENKISFSKGDGDQDPVWESDCGEVFAEDDAITEMEVTETIYVTDGANLFSGSAYIQNMDLALLDVSAVTDMSAMFSGCSSLVSVDVSTWNTANVTNMSAMFNNCSSLTGLDVSRWVTSSVTNMGGMFYNCQTLEDPDVSEWNTSAVTVMSWMFYNCSSLTDPEVSAWNTSSVQFMDYMFSGCSGLSDLDLSDWTTAGVSDMTQMFSGCSSLTSLDLSGWNTSALSDSTSNVFTGCDLLNTLTLGENSLGTIFTSLPKYSSTWYYFEPGLTYGTAKEQGTLFTEYNGNTMAGTWSTNQPQAKSVMIKDPSGTDITGKTVTTESSGYQLRAAAVPSTAVQNFIWTSSDQAVAEVSSSGKVSFKKAGTVRITASAVDGSGVSAAVNISYTPLAAAINIQNSSGAYITGKTVIMKSSDYQLLASAIPAEAEQKFTWMSSNSGIAEVSSSGAVSFKKAGTVTITAAAVDGSGVSAIVKITYVPSASAVTILDPSGSDITGKTNTTETSVYQLQAAAVPAGAEQKFIWTASDNTVATVDQTGKVSFKKTGTVTITAKADDGSNVSAKVIITYMVPAASVSIQDPSGTDITGKTFNIDPAAFQLKAAALPAEAEQKFTWTSSDSNIASVDAAGKVRFRKAGTVTITAAAADGSNVSASVTISYDPVISFVNRCYDKIMGRKADAGGRAYYTERLKSGNLTGAQMVMNFINSPEFQGKKYSSEQVVEILYITMMDRTADAGGRAYWAAFLNDGLSQKYVVRGFAGSKEFKNICSSYGITAGTLSLTENRDKNPKVTAFVSRNYSIALGRKGDAGGLNYWAGKILDKKLTPQQVADSFVFSKECVNKNLSDENFVKMLYNLYMGRNFDQGGLNYWLENMRKGMTRQTVAKSFGNSKEFREIVASYGL